MEFRPAISPHLRPMDARIFAEGPMGLRTELQTLPIDRRLTYDAGKNLFFVNFESHSIRSPADIDAIRAEVERKLGRLGHRVDAIVDYDNFSVSPELLDPYIDMVREVVARYYNRVTRYTTSAFTRAQIGDALSHRRLSAHLFDNHQAALEELRKH